MGKAVGTPVLSGLMLGSQTPPFPPGSLLHGQRRCHTGAQGLLPHQIIGLEREVWDPRLP